DVARDRLGGIPPLAMPEDLGGPKGYRTFRPLLVADKVRHVGERVAFVVAATAAQAREAAELVEVDYEPLPAAASVEDAIKDGQQRSDRRRVRPGPLRRLVAAAQQSPLGERARAPRSHWRLQ